MENANASDDQNSTTNVHDILELYRTYVTDLGNIGTRYATANGFYLSVISVMLGILAFTEADKPLNQVDFIVVVGVPLFGCVICWIWLKTLDFYSTLFLTKFTVLRKMEERLPFDCYTREAEFLEKMHREKKLLIRLIPNERRVPIVLAILFAGISVVSIIMTIA